MTAARPVRLSSTGMHAIAMRRRRWREGTWTGSAKWTIACAAGPRGGCGGRDARCSTRGRFWMTRFPSSLKMTARTGMDRRMDVLVESRFTQLERTAARCDVLAAVVSAAMHFPFTRGTGLFVFSGWSQSSIPRLSVPARLARTRPLLALASNSMSYSARAPRRMADSRQLRTLRIDGDRHSVPALSLVAHTPRRSVRVVRGGCSVIDGVAAVSIVGASSRRQVGRGGADDHRPAVPGVLVLGGS